MSASQITYTDKVNNSTSGLAANKKVADVDMNEIKTVVNDNAQLHDTLQAQVDDLGLIAGSVPLTYKYDSNTVAGDPGAGFFRFDFNDPISASNFYVSKTDTAFATLGLWGLVSSGSYVYIKTRDDDSGGVLFSVSTATDNTTYFAFAMAGVDSGVMTNGDICSIQLFIPSVAGSGDVATDTIWDSKGDMVAATGSNAATKVVVGSNGQVLTADSTQTNGVKWDNVDHPIQLAMALSDENVTDLTASTSVPVWTKYIALDMLLTNVYFDVVTAPVGAAITIDIHKNGTTIFSTRPTIASTANISSGETISTPSFSRGDKMEIFVDTVGSTTAGKGLKGDIVGNLT